MKLNNTYCYVLSAAIAGVSGLYAVQASADDHNDDKHDHKGMNLPITHGIAVGDVDESSAIVWARTNAAGYMHVLLQGKGVPEAVHKHIEVNAVKDFTGKVKLENLRADTSYQYRVWFTKQKQGHVAENKATGHFRTAPQAEQAKPVAFAWGGDLAGQNVCRDVDEGFPIFNAINDMGLDFFIGLGDMIYADGTCTGQGLYGNAQIVGNYDKAANMANYWAHWKYNHEDAGYQKLQASMPYYAIWDDHEVVNDFGPLHDTRNSAPYQAGQHLLPLGLRAFLDYNPVSEDVAQPKRLYRSIRWGKQFELFVLDTRQYRDANSENDDEALTKTMLGREQLTWLKEKLNTSDATWKMIVSSVPISIPTGWPAENGRDGWSNFDQDTGFEQELRELFSFMRDKGINNSVWITTDVHFASVFRYTPFADTPEFQVHEFVTGPLNAGLFPNRDFDTSMGTERLFFYGPESSNAVSSYEEARKWMNYGAVNIDENGVMKISIHDVEGDVLYTQTLYSH